jgi:hypothetical protein
VLVVQLALQVQLVLLEVLEELEVTLLLALQPCSLLMVVAVVRVEIFLH